MPKPATRKDRRVASRVAGRSDETMDAVPISVRYVGARTRVSGGGFAALSNLSSNYHSYCTMAKLSYRITNDDGPATMHFLLMGPSTFLDYLCSRFVA
jgi:hypothetical protein